MVERRPEEPRVGGSIPSPGTTVIPVRQLLPLHLERSGEVFFRLSYCLTLAI